MESLSFVYHPTFDRTAGGVLTDEQMVAVEEMLIADPRKGDVIQGTGAIAGAWQEWWGTTDLCVYRGRQHDVLPALLSEECAG